MKVQGDLRSKKCIHIWIDFQFCTKPPPWQESRINIVVKPAQPLEIAAGYRKHSGVFGCNVDSAPSGITVCLKVLARYICCTTKDLAVHLF